MENVKFRKILKSKFINRKSMLGFTLIELLIAVTIMAVLSAIGLSVYNGMQGKSRDAKKRADVETIAGVLETNYSSAAGYPASLQDSYFASGSTPVPPGGGSYTFIVNSARSAFIVCADVEVGVKYCARSVRYTCSVSDLSAAYGLSCGDGGYNVNCDVYPDCHIDAQDTSILSAQLEASPTRAP